MEETPIKKTYQKEIDLLGNGSTQVFTLNFEHVASYTSCKMYVTLSNGRLLHSEVIGRDESHEKELRAWMNGEQAGAVLADNWMRNVLFDAKLKYEEYLNPKNFMIDQGFTIETSTQQ